jgi:UDP-N-acetylmuramoylalanine--D-glutamate ligase
MKNILIIGFGVSGRGAAKLAIKNNYQIFVYDDKIEKLIQNPKECDFFIIKELNELNFLNFDFIIKSPGVRDDSQIMKYIFSKNLKVIDEIEFGYLFLGNRSKIIAVTGTNGKSTTCSIIFHVLKKYKFSVDLVGNIGKSFCDSLSENIKNIYVIELSSFQLKYIDKFKPFISVILNLSKNHLDVHQDMEEYLKCKFNIVKNLEEDNLFIFNGLDELTVDFMKELENKKFKIVNYLSNIDKAKDHQSLIGYHNKKNLSAAISVLENFDLNEEKINSSLVDFVALKHRIQYVRTIENIEFYNDSKSTTIDSTKAAIKCFDKPVVWIMGGIDKGNDYKKIESFLGEKIYYTIILAQNSNKIASFFEKKIDFFCTNLIKDALEFAYEIVCWPGMVVLFSPSCASYDLFKDYQERGDKFVECVYNLKKWKT